jgi:hypothetical protein
VRKRNLSRMSRKKANNRLEHYGAVRAEVQADR